jgi:hypothetical protein
MSIRIRWYGAQFRMNERNFKDCFKHGNRRNRKAYLRMGMTGNERCHAEGRNNMRGNAGGGGGGGGALGRQR